MKLILASASPRRRELLGRFGIPFEVVVSDAPEIRLATESPSVFAQRVAFDKANEVAKRLPEAAVLAADTIVVLGDEVFGKPRDRGHAAEMLRRLSGQTHQVVTGVAAIVPGNKPMQTLAISDVTFRVIDDDELRTYLDSDEPYDKAGAYAIQGAAGAFVAERRGSLSNIIGLPLGTVFDLLRDHFDCGPRPENDE